MNGQYPARERWLKRKAQFARLPEWADKLVRLRVAHYIGAVPRTVSHADLYAAGWYGALRGVAAYRRGHGTTLRTWVRHWVDGELRHCVRRERSARGHKGWQQDRRIGGMRECSMSELSEEQREVLEGNQSQQELRQADCPDYTDGFVIEQFRDGLDEKRCAALDAMLEQADGLEVGEAYALLGVSANIYSYHRARLRKHYKLVQHEEQYTLGGSGR